MTFARMQGQAFGRISSQIQCHNLDMTKAEGDNLVIDKADREAEVDSQHETTNKLTVDKGLSRD